MLSVLALLSSTALALDTAPDAPTFSRDDARAVFQDHVIRLSEFDPTAFDLLSDDAAVDIEQDGHHHRLSGQQLKAQSTLLARLAEQQDDVWTYDKVRIKKRADGFVVKARRASAARCYTDPHFEARLAPRGDTLRIVSIEGTTTALSRCAAPPELARQLETLHDEIAPHLPLAIDQDTELADVHVVAANLVYEMRLTRLDAEAIDRRDLKTPLRSGLGRMYCADPTVRPLLEQGATLRVTLSDRDGGFVQHVDVNRDVCGLLERATPGSGGR